MNEITRIHLGRVAYTISVEAHAQLKKYLAEIEKRVSDKEVVREVELRMSELLAERGITAEKVILPEDIDFLQEQLGSPKDFAGEEDETAATENEEKTGKRLFRDTDNAMIAGVSAGLAKFFGLDPVIVRIIFVAVTLLSGGAAIFIYLLLWLIVPPAETASEKLQMQGKAVTLDALKESVNNADVPGAARRVNSKVLPVINGLFQLVVKMVGLGFIFIGIMLVFSMAVLGSYMLLHNGQLTQENLFPVGFREHLLVWLGMLLVAILAVFLTLIGIQSFTRKWPVRSWITGLLAGIFLLALAATAALVVDTVPRVKDRYEALYHTAQVENIQAFDKIVAAGNVEIQSVQSPNYAVSLRYFDHPDLSKLHIRTENGTLYIDAKDLAPASDCTMLCLQPDYSVTVQVHAPNIDMRNVQGSDGVGLLYTDN